MPKPVSVAVMTHAGGAHLGAYYAALRDDSNVNQVVLSDPDGTHQAAAAKALGDKLVKTWRSHSEMLAEARPDLALITMEASQAPPVITQALEAGCHVFAEKPACLRAEDFAQLKKLADSRHLLLMLALANRLNPEMQQARQLIRKGTIGRVYGLEMHLVADQTRLTRTSYHKSWFAQKDRSGGGHLAWLGIHWLDLSTFLTGSHITQVTGFAGNVGGQPIDIEDSAALALQYERDGHTFFGTLTSGYYLDRGYHSHIRIWGSHGWVQVSPMAETKLHWYTSRESPPAEHDWTGNANPRGYSPFVAAAVSAVAGEAEPPVTAKDGLQVLRVVHGLYEASRTGQTQTISQEA